MEWEVWEGTVLMATVPGMALVGVEGQMEETEGEEAEEGTVVVVGMEEEILRLNNCLVLQLGGAHNTKSAEVFKVPLLREIII